MNKYIFNIIVKTDKVLNNADKSEILADFRARLNGYSTECPKCLKEADIQITREVTMDDIGEALKGIPKANPVNPETCWYYDEAQGRHHCTNDLVKCIKCEGVCKYYRSV